MDTETTDRRIISDPPLALPGVCARVFVPRQVNFLRTIQGGHIPLGELSQADATLLALAQARALLNHHHHLATQANRLSQVEEDHAGLATLTNPGLVERIAREQGGLTDVAWHLADPCDRARACDQVRATLTLFLEELHCV